MRVQSIAAVTAIFACASVLAAVTPSNAPAKAPPKPAPAKPAAAAAAPTREESWYVAPAADGAIAYDAKSIVFDPELSTASIQSLVYLKTGAKTKSGAAFYYVLSEDQVDCIGSQYKPKSRFVLDATGKMLSAGDVPANAPWAPLTGNAPLSALRGVACSGATFKDMIRAPNFAAAIKAMREMK